MLLFLLLVVAVAAVGGLWPGLAAAVGGFLLVNWFFIQPLPHVHDRRGRGRARALRLPRRRRDRRELRRARRPPGGRRSPRPRRGRGAFTARRLLDRLGACSRASAACSGSTGRRSSTATKAAGGSRRRAATAFPRAPRRARTTIELDSEHVLALTGAPVRSEDQRVLDAFAKELAASVHLGELEAGAETAGAVYAANELRAALLSAVSHDLRTPISAIKASVTSLLQRDVEWTPEARQEFLETIDEETDRLNALVGNLLDMSRLQAGALEISAVPVGLDEVLPAALQQHRRPATAQSQLDVPETLPRVLADRGLLERALANVISNAVRFSPPGSPARVTAGVVDGVVDVRVVDRGPGVPQAERERLFKPFQRLGDSGQSEGVGLGLAVAKGFLEAMGGEIEADDTPGGGLTIVARLRAAE